MVITVPDDGWFVNETALADVYGEDPVPSDRKQLTSDLLDEDIHDFGLPCITDKLDKKTGIFKGPCTLQLSKTRNVSQPRLHEQIDKNGLIRLDLTDGHICVSLLIIDPIKGIGTDVAPGTKILLSGRIPYENKFLIVDQEHVKVLGGSVDKLIDKWNAEKSGFRTDRNAKPYRAPKWVSFTKKGAAAAVSANTANTRNFKANEALQGAAVKKERGDEEEEFDKQRQKLIDEASSKATASFVTPQNLPKPKPQSEVTEHQYERKPMKEKLPERGHDRRQKGRRRGGDDDDDAPVPAEFSRPSGTPSLFDFLAASAPDVATTAVIQAQHVQEEVSFRTNYTGNGQRQEVDSRRRQIPNQNERPRRGNDYQSRTDDTGPQRNYKQRNEAQGQQGARNRGNQSYQSDRQVSDGRNRNYVPNQEGGPPRRPYEEKNFKGRGSGGNQEERRPQNQYSNQRPQQQRQDQEVRRQFDGNRNREDGKHPRIPPGKEGGERQFNRQREGGIQQHAQPQHSGVNQNQGYGQGSSQFRGPPSARGQFSRDVSDVTHKVKQMGIGGEARTTDSGLSGPRPVAVFVPRNDASGHGQAVQKQGRGPQAPVQNSVNRRPGAGNWKLGDRCMAPWDDGQFYVSTIVYVGPGTMCSVRYEEYGNTKTLPQGVLVVI